MRRHDDEIEAVPSNLGDLRRRITCHADSGELRDWKLFFEKRVEPLARDLMMFFGNFPDAPNKIQFEAVVAGGVKDVNQWHFGANKLAALFT